MMSSAQTDRDERTEHAKGSDAGHPDAQRVYGQPIASRTAGGGGHGASSGVCNELKRTEQTNMRQYRAFLFEAKSDMKDSSCSQEIQAEMDVKKETLTISISDEIDTKQPTELQVSDQAPEGFEK